MSVSIADQMEMSGSSGSAGHAAPNRQKPVHLTASVLAYLAFCLLMLSLRPFGAVSLFIEEEGVDGDRLNQIGFFIAGTITLLGLVTLVNRRLLSTFLTPAWLAVAGVLLISVIVAPEPEDATRSVALTLIGMMIAASIVLLPPDEKAFQRIAATAILTVLAVSYIGVTILPDVAIHGSSKYEPQHAGLWHGHFSHKNVAGPVMSVFVMFGIYLWRSKLHLAGAIITVLALLFVIQTGSKTTNGLLPIAIAVVFAGRIVGLPQLTIGLYVTVVAIMTGLTLGTIYSDNWASYAEAFIGDPTFSGRVTLWQYGLENVGKNLWFGTGYDSFWGTSTVRDLEFPFDQAWDFRGIVHGHSNFVDMAVTTGLFGFLILFWVLYLAPVINYLKACRVHANSNLADLFMMILVFMTLLSFLESFFLRRIDPIWLMMFMAVAGLQLTARFRTT